MIINFIIITHKVLLQLLKKNRNIDNMCNINYYDRLFPNNPFITINKWSDAKHVMQGWDEKASDKIIDFFIPI